MINLSVIVPWIHNIIASVHKCAHEKTSKLFEWGEERNLLVSPINEGEFYSFLTSFESFLKGLLVKLDYGR